MRHHSHGRGRVHTAVCPCPNGCVCLVLGPTQVHLPPPDFRNLLDAMLEAAVEMGIRVPATVPVRPLAAEGVEH